MKKTLIAISMALAAHVLMADALQDTPANVDVSFRGEGGLVDGAETACRTFAAGACYGALPTPVREGHAFEGWYTDEGVKVVETDYVISSATNLTARWDVRLDGTEGDVRKGNDAIYSDRTGIVIPVPDDSWDYDSGNYFGAVCEVESIVSFDWVVDATPEAVEAGEYNYWWVYVLREFSVDGKAVEAEGDHGYTHLAWYNDETGVRIHVRAFLTPGSHVLKWAVPCGYAEGATVRCAVENFKVEPVARQTDIVGWARLLADFGIWKPDNLAYLLDSVYGARVAANPDDYEARVIRAAIKIAMLAEDKKVRDFLGECGWTVADYTMKLSGGFCGFDCLAPANDVVDRLSPVTLAALDDALADLNAIPENWNGAIELSPKKYDDGQGGNGYKRLSGTVAEGLVYRVGRERHPRITCSACRVGKIKLGLISLGAFNTVELDDLVINVPERTADLSKGSQRQSQNLSRSVQSGGIGDAALPLCSGRGASPMRPQRGLQSPRQTKGGKGDSEADAVVDALNLRPIVAMAHIKAKKFASIRISRLQINRMSGERLLPILKAESLKNSGKRMTLQNVVLYRDGRELALREAELEARPRFRLVWPDGAWDLTDALKPVF